MTESSYMIAPGERDAFMRRKLAAELYQKSVSPQPIDHWTQGLAQMLNAGLSGYKMHQLDQQERDETAKGNEMIAKLLAGGGPPAAPAMPSEPTAPTTGPRMAAALTGGPDPVAPPRPPVQSTPKVWGDDEAVKAGLYDPPKAAPMPAPPVAPMPPAPIPAQTANGGTVAPGTTLQPGLNREALLAMLGNRQTRPMAQGIVQAQIAEQFKPRDQWIDEKGPDGSFYQRHVRTGERKVLEKSDVLPEQAVIQKERIAKAGKQEINIGGGSDKQIFDAMDESSKAARAAATGLGGLREASAALQAGVITGAGADVRLGLQKVGAALGIADSDKIVNTETFRAAIAPQVAAMLKSTVGTANISNSDREFAEKAAGGNINLDDKSIVRLVGIMERAGSAIVESHQKRLEKVYPDAEKFARERALFGVDMPAPPIAPPPQQTAPQSPTRQEIEAELRRRGRM